MECEKLKKLYAKFCENDIKHNDINIAIARELRNKNCLKTVDLFIKHCNKYDSIDKKRCTYDEK